MLKSPLTSVLKLVQQSRQQALRSYCPNVYTVVEVVEEVEVVTDIIVFILHQHESKGLHLLMLRMYLGF